MNPNLKEGTVLNKDMVEGNLTWYLTEYGIEILNDL